MARGVPAPRDDVQGRGRVRTPLFWAISEG